MTSPRYRALLPGLCAVVFVFFATVASAALPKVLVLGSESSPAALADVKNKLTATGRFAQVDSLRADTNTPALSVLRGYDAVLVYAGNEYFLDAAALGDVLADYVDRGGGLVVAGFATGNGAIGGRLRQDSYLALQGRGSAAIGSSSLVPVLPGHPLLAGTSVFPGGPNGEALRDQTTLTPGAVLVAKWNDGLPLAAYRDRGAHRVVNLAFSPVSADAQVGSWNATSSGARLLANALVYSMAVDLRPSAAIVTDSPAAAADIADKLQKTRTFGNVEIIDASTVTPPLSQLQQYTSVLLHSQTDFADANLLGDVLADFVEAGGGLVLTAPRTANSPHPGGRLAAAGYLAFPNGLGTLSSGDGLTTDLADHPLLLGVDTATFGTSSFYNQPLADGTVQVAHFTSASAPAVVVRTVNDFKVTTLNFEPTSTDYDAHGWAANTAVGQLIANALAYSSAPPAPPVVTAQAPTNVTSTGAILHATVDPRGRATTIYFYLNGQLVGSVSVPAGYGSREVQLQLSNLTGNRQYYVTVYGENSLGGSLGAENGGISVQTPNSTPAVVDVNVAYTGQPVVVDVLGTASDADGDRLSVAVNALPYGTTQVLGSVVIYTPDQTFPGQAFTTFVVSDGKISTTHALNITSSIPVANVIAKAGPAGKGDTVQGRTGGKLVTLGTPCVYAGGQVGGIMTYLPTGATKPVSAILGGNGFQVQQQTGDFAADIANAVYGKLGQPVFGATAYAFSATLAPAPGKTLPAGPNQGLWLSNGVQTRCVALTDSPTILPASGTGVRYAKILAYGLAQYNSTVYYIAKLQGAGITPGKNDVVLERAHFSGPNLVKAAKIPLGDWKDVQLFTPAPGLPSQPRGLANFARAITLSTNAAGQRFFRIHTNNDDSIDLSSYPVTGPVEIPNTTFASVTPPCVGGNSQSYFLATLKNASPAGGVSLKNNLGIFRLGSPFTTVVRTGTPGPVPNSTYTGFSQPAASEIFNDQHLAFTATLAGTPPAQKTVLMWENQNVLTVVAQTGKPAAGLPSLTYAQFVSFALPPVRVGPVFLAKLAGPKVNATNNTALFARSLTSGVLLLARTGTPFQVGQEQKTISLISTLNATTEAPTQNRFVNGENNVVALLTFTDHSTAIVRWYVP